MVKELPELGGLVEFDRLEAAPLEPAGARRTVWEGNPATAEVVAPDRHCARLFLELMGPLFPYELVGTGTSWVIRLEPPPGSVWASTLLRLVERWLEACPLPCATIRYRGRAYVFRSPLTHTEIWTGFEGPQGLEPSRVAFGSTAGAALAVTRP